MNVFKKLYRLVVNKFGLLFKRKKKKVHSHVEFILDPEIEKSINEITNSPLNDLAKSVKTHAEEITKKELKDIKPVQNETFFLVSSDVLKTKVEFYNSKLINLGLSKIKLFNYKYSPVEILKSHISKINTLISALNERNATQFKLSTSLATVKTKNDFEVFFNDCQTISQFNSREIEKRKQEEIKRKHLNKQIDNIDILIKNNNLHQAKEIINSLTILITNLRLSKEEKRLQKVIDRLHEKEKDNQRKIEVEAQKRHWENVQKLIQEEVLKQQKQEEEEKLDFIENIEFESILNDYRIDYLYHMTDITNLESVLEHGLLAHDEAHDTGLNQTDISMHDVNNRRANKTPIFGISLHKYVPTYFNPKNPMLFVRRERQNNIVILAIARKVIYQDKSMFTDGNAASKGTTFYNDIEDLCKLNWRCIREGFWNDFHDGKRIRCAETLGYPKIKAKYILKIYCNNIKTKSVIDELLNNKSNIRAEINSKWYF